MSIQLPKAFPALALALMLSACASFADVNVGPVPGESDQYLQVHAGLTQDEVRGIAGSPTRVTGPSRAGETKWTYVFEDTSGYSSKFEVTFDADGRVSDTSLNPVDY
jgi:outer membrane protein assembly factor BamE (lipoprotein component of BamABCDE complex)